MEDSVNFSCDRERRGNDDFEESGWTMYLDDFYSHTDHNNYDNSSTFSSLVSDAASLVMNKSKINYDNHDHSLRLSLMKKRKTRGADDDDALEDTATSPVNSPKVYDLVNQFNQCTKQKDRSANIDPEAEKGKKDMGWSRYREDDDASLMTESGGSELKKKGLCLVPLSTVVNYFG